MEQSKINVKLMSMAGQGGSVFGMALPVLAQSREDIRVLSADMSTPAGLDKFKAAYPERFINVGIAEQNLIGCAAGLASEGLRPICVAQSCFLSMRSFEQIRQYAGYMKFPIIIAGIASGLSLQFFGNTHFAVEDIALMRMVPGMTVVCPCDSLEAVKAFESALEHDGPVYIRMFGGTGVPSVYAQDYDFSLGRAIVLRDGKDVQIIAAGSVVKTALDAAAILEQEGVQASVVNMHTIKPLDSSAIALDKKLLVTVEEHRRFGGLGGAVSEYLSGMSHHPELLRLGFGDDNIKVGGYGYMMQESGLSADGVVHSILNKLKE